MGGDASPEAQAAAAKAQPLILAACEKLRPRHRRDGTRVAEAITKNDVLRSTYRNAVAAGDTQLANALTFGAAGFLSEWMEWSTAASTFIVALLLSQRKRGMQFSEGVLNAMVAVKMVGPLPEL